MSVGWNLSLCSRSDLAGSEELTERDSVKNLEDNCLGQDLKDIWRIRNPIITCKGRLDFWLVSDTFQENFDSVDITPSTKSDHSAITLSLQVIPHMCIAHPYCVENMADLL